MRDYTRWRPRRRWQLTLEFALHGHGAASWAQQAEEGMQAIIAGPKGSMIIPAQQDWHLLVGDASSLPAIRRRLAELPPSAHVEVILLRATAMTAGTATAGALEVSQLADGDALLAALRNWQVPDGHGFAWCAGEGGLMRQARTILLEENSCRVKG
jgi:NADPH-dependent ferric siderophore reductase